MIDRRSVVGRHDVSLRSLVPTSPLSVGNGELCFTVDLTGLQSLPEAYPLSERAGGAPGTLLGTQAQWGWHSIPPPGGRVPSPTRRSYATRRGSVPYVELAGDLELPPGVVPTGDHWLRANPHRLDLARIGFRVEEGGRLRGLSVGEVCAPRQQLELWSGLLRSEFLLDGFEVDVRTACHPGRDVIAVRVRSEALVRSGLCVSIAFPYGSSSWNCSADWSLPEAHGTTVTRRGRGWAVQRALDETSYSVQILGDPVVELRQAEAHLLVIRSGGPELDLSVAFRPGHLGAGAVAGEAAGAAGEVPPFPEVEAASRRHWAGFWESGAAIDLGESSDPRAPELERRVVLSQYLTAINSAGSLPPQETGLTVSSWYGRFHLEMYWWHSAHFALWGRPELLERSMGWYRSRLEVARELAGSQGYRGARWPKQVGPDGREGPSPISSFLIWQQPHPIYLAELCWRAEPSRETLERYAPVVLESATFMADFAEPTPSGYALGPPLVPAQECYAADRARMTNPTFELAYWSWALSVAKRWRERLGLAPEPSFGKVADELCRPLVRRGTYAAVGAPPYLRRRDHPSMLLGLGFLPPTPLIDPTVMGATLDDVLAEWDWESTWGWDFPAIAMTAARLGRPRDALAALLREAEKNTYLPSGHNRQSPTLPVYLPGNGGLLAAVALMAGGWDGADRPAPGFPVDGTWQLKQEGFSRAP